MRPSSWPEVEGGKDGEKEREKEREKEGDKEGGIVKINTCL